MSERAGLGGLRRTLDALVLRGLSRDVAHEVWQAGAFGMAASLEAASDEALAEISRLWVARETNAAALGRNVAQASQNRDLTASEVENPCGCHSCIGGKPAGGTSWLTVGMTRMIVCSECGNKRCPHGTDHRNECTGSNEPGQTGSRYPPLNLTRDDRTPEERARDFFASIDEDGEQ